MSRTSTNQSSKKGPATPGLRERRRRENLSRIVEAASHVFATHGFERTTMEMVAQRAQMGKASLYHYFPTKQSLFLEMLKQSNDKLARAVNHAISNKPENKSPNIALILNAAIEAFREQRTLLGLFLALHAGGTKYLKSLVGEQILADIQGVHQPIMEHLSCLLGPNSEKVKPIIISFLLGLAIRVIHGSDKDAAQEVEVFTEMLQDISKRSS